MQVQKRDGTIVPFDPTKIRDAVLATFAEVDGEITNYARNKANVIASDIQNSCADEEFLEVEDIQDEVINRLMASQRKDVARAYVEYRYKKYLLRQYNTTDKSILELLDGTNEYWNKENSNKNSSLATTQRDYLAGITSTDISMRLILPEDVVKAHKEGIIHFHDADYFLQHMHNCDLINLDDMLQNGTIISGVMIEKPHSFSTACNIATQAVAQVASSQYGGQTITLTHLAPFVDVSRRKLQEEVYEEIPYCSPEQRADIVERRLKREITKGIQTIQYQITTLMTTNGQAPFITVFMYLGEARSKQEEKDLAMLIEEVLKQRIQGVKNEQGVWITPAFPKLIYVLDENNIEKDSEYYWLTELAAKCTAKRMVPDYISAKKMRELKGDVYPAMGCRSFLTPDRFTDVGIGNIEHRNNYEEGKHRYYGRLTLHY